MQEVLNLLRGLVDVRKYLVYSQNQLHAIKVLICEKNVFLTTFGVNEVNILQQCKQRDILFNVLWCLSACVHI